jgi:hypothetical protein
MGKGKEEKMKKDIKVEMYTTNQIADKLGYTKFHILNIAKANKISPAKEHRPLHGLPHFYWTEKEVSLIKEQLGKKRGRPFGKKT